jgi:hypothetical protein
MTIPCLAFGSDFNPNCFSLFDNAYHKYANYYRIHKFRHWALRWDVWIQSISHSHSFKICLNIIMPLTWFISSGFPNKINYKFNVTGPSRTYRTLAHVRYLLTLYGNFFFHPPYSSDVAPSDFHFFTHTWSIVWAARAWVAMKTWRRRFETGLMDWRQISTMQAYRNSSHDITSAWIFIGLCRKMI